MKYFSICSGIEAATVAWHKLGWECVGVSEIDPFACAVLAHHYPNVPNYGDMTKHAAWRIPAGSVDVLVGGTPCQSFSVAGLRKGLADPRGNLALTWLSIIDQIKPRYTVWENVPGVLSSDGGRDFGALLGGMAELGYGFAYRVLDAQFVRVESHPRAVPQRRRRVFVVGCAGGDWERAAEVLSLAESVRGNPPPRRASRQRTPARVESGTGSRRAEEVGEREPTKGYWVEDAVPETCGTIADGAHHGGGLNGQDAYTGRILPVSFYSRLGSNGGGHAIDVSVTLKINGNGAQPSAVARTELMERTVTIADMRGNESHGCSPPLSAKDTANDFMPIIAVALCEGAHGVTEMDVTTSVQSSGGKLGQGMQGVRIATEVRRLTPRECERLQGFPDDYTLIPYRGKPAADGNRYKVLGNSMAVNVMRWLGDRIAEVDRKVRE